MSKAFYEYEQVIENLDIEATTSVETDALIEEMAGDTGLENFEFCLLCIMVSDMMKRGRK